MDIPKKIQDRRRSVRIRENIPITFSHQGFDLEATILNISLHGAMTLLDKNLPAMTQLKIAILLPPFGKPAKKRKILVKGVVVRKEKDPRSDKFFVAIFFSDLKPESRKALEGFIDERLKTG